MFENTRPCPCLTFACIFSFLFATSAFAAPRCDGALDLESNTVRRASTSENKLFRLTFPSSGIATVDLASVATASNWIEIRAEACGEPVDALVLEQSATELVLGVRKPGHLFLATGGETTFSRLMTSFVEAEVSEEVLDLGSLGQRAVQTTFWVASPGDKTELEVSDPDPDGQMIDADVRAVSTQGPGQALTLKTELEVSDPDPDGLIVGVRQILARVLALESAFSPKTELEVSDPDPDGASAPKLGPAGLARPNVLLYQPHCRRTEVDDHGDTATCSTPLALGRIETGTVANDWQDDRDVFSFNLEQVSSIEIVLAAEHSGLTVALAGPDGHRLDVDHLQDNDGGDLRLGATLAPGRYVLHVMGTPGAYALNVLADG